MWQGSVRVWCSYWSTQNTSSVSIGGVKAALAPANGNSASIQLVVWTNENSTTSRCPATAVTHHFPASMRTSFFIWIGFNLAAILQSFWLFSSYLTMLLAIR